LWDVSGFETETPVAGAAAADDLWGSFEATPAADLPPAPAEAALADDSWGSDDFSSAFAEDAGSDPFAMGAGEVPLADDLEILEEIDLLEPAADSFATDDFSFAEEMFQPETDAAPGVLIAPAPPVATPLPLPVVDVVPQEIPTPSLAGTATSVATLSDAQLELIVERVAGVVVSRLAGTLLEKIAWEVVPDLAETMIKEELRKIRETVAAG
jgi:hypothetical protein